MDPELDLDKLLESYDCDSRSPTCDLTTKNLRWRCLALSSMSELHTGFLSFNAGLDYVVSRAHDVIFSKFLILSLCN